MIGTFVKPPAVVARVSNLGLVFFLLTAWFSVSALRPSKTSGGISGGVALETRAAALYSLL